MHTRTGEIIHLKDGEDPRNPFKRMNIPVTNRQMRRHPPKIGRNDPCGCGSGKKFKHCCWIGENPEEERVILNKLFSEIKIENSKLKRA